MHVDIIELVSLRRKEKKRKGKNDGYLPSARGDLENQRSGDAAIAADIENRKKTGGLGSHRASHYRRVERQIAGRIANTSSPFHVGIFSIAGHQRSSESDPLRRHYGGIATREHPSHPPRNLNCNSNSSPSERSNGVANMNDEEKWRVSSPMRREQREKERKRKREREKEGRTEALRHWIYPPLIAHGYIVQSILVMLSVNRPRRIHFLASHALFTLLHSEDRRRGFETAISRSREKP